MALLARPGQSLSKHLHAVAEYSRRIVEKKKLDFDSLNEQEICKAAQIIGACHDFGKATSFFQDYISRPDTYPHRKKKQHASISAFYAYYVLKKEDFDDTIALMGWLVVQRHHGNLENMLSSDGLISSKARNSLHTDLLKEQGASIKEAELEELKQIYQPLDMDYVEDFLREFDEGNIFSELSRLYFQYSTKEFPIQNYYLTLFLYSILLDCDKMNSAEKEFETWPSVGRHRDVNASAVDKYKKAKFSKPKKCIDKLREKAYKQVNEAVKKTDERLLSITLPTGGGKTLTALNAALKLRERAVQNGFKRPPRIIYSLPFLSIIDQNHKVIKDVLEHSDVSLLPEVLLRHDYKSSGFAREEHDEDAEIENPDKPLLLTEGWNSEIITTTFTQFFETLVTNRNANARKFHKMVNSIILLDEIQAVPTGYWDIIKEGLNVLTNEFNSYVILLTATNPLIFRPGEEIHELVPEHRSYFKEFDRIDYQISLEERTLDEFEDELIAELKNNPGKSVMVVVNTINCSKELYRRVEKKTNRKIIYLSTNILPKERETRIQEIKDSNEPLLVITTQLIEAGVDIDIDVVYRDFAPLDSIVQTAGRCNREDGKRKGIVKVLFLKTDNECWRFFSNIYDSTLRNATRQTLNIFGSQIPEAKFNTRVLEEYFNKVHERTSKDKKSILQEIKRLNYGKIHLRLIEQDYQTIPVFVSLDKEAEEVYKKVRSVYKKYNRFERRDKMLRLKSRFYSYILNVRVSGDEDNASFIPLTDFSENIFLIPKDNIKDWYDDVTGFKIPDETIEMRLI